MFCVILISNQFFLFYCIFIILIKEKNVQITKGIFLQGTASLHQSLFTKKMQLCVHSNTSNAYYFQFILLSVTIGFTINIDGNYLQNPVLNHYNKNLDVFLNFQYFSSSRFYVLLSGHLLPRARNEYHLTLHETLMKPQLLVF